MRYSGTKSRVADRCPYVIADVRDGHMLSGHVSPVHPSLGTPVLPVTDTLFLMSREEYRRLADRRRNRAAVTASELDVRWVHSGILPGFLVIDGQPWRIEATGMTVTILKSKTNEI